MKKPYDIGFNKVNILLEEREEYNTLEKLKKHFEKEQVKKDEFVKITYEEDCHYVEFLPLSEDGKIFFTDYILNENFGKPTITEKFFQSLETLNSFDRILTILNHTVALQEDWAIHTYAQAFFKKILDKDYEDTEIEEEVLEYKKLLDASNNFLISYHGRLYRELCMAVDAFRYSNSIDDISNLIENKQSVINTCAESFLLSPLLFPCQQWKDLVIHEFSIVKDINRLDGHKKRFISLIKELEYRIGFNKIPIISTFREVKSKDLINIPYFFHFNWGTHFFKSNLKEYFDFIASISLNEIRKKNRDVLLAKLKRQEKERVELLKAEKNSKVEIAKNYRHVINGLTYLMSKSNPEEDILILKKIAQKTISEIFHVPIKVGKNPTPENFKFSNQLLLEYVILLEKRNYINYNPKISVPKIIAKNCSLNVRGMTQSNLYHILKKLSYNPENIQDIKLSFQGLTSEIALLNEMKN